MLKGTKEDLNPLWKRRSVFVIASLLSRSQEFWVGRAKSVFLDCVVGSPGSTPSLSLSSFIDQSNTTPMVFECLGHSNSIIAHGIVAMPVLFVTECLMDSDYCAR